MSKHRTKHPRRPWADPTAPLRLLHGGRPFDEAEQAQLSLPVHLALEALDVYREYDPEGGGVADKVAAALRERLGVKA